MLPKMIVFIPFDQPSVFLKTGNNCFHFKFFLLKLMKIISVLLLTKASLSKLIIITAIYRPKKTVLNLTIIISILPTKVFLLKLVKIISVLLLTKASFIKSDNNYCNLPTKENCVESDNNYFHLTDQSVDVVVQNDVRPTVLGLDRFYCLGLCGTARSFLFFNYSCDVYLSLLRIVPYVVV